MSSAVPVKCVVVGDGAVGKTCLLISYTRNVFDEEYVPTISDNYSVNCKRGVKTYCLNLWDTSGQPDYDRLRPLSYPDTDVILICYSVTHPPSYQNVITKWIPEIKHHLPNCPIVLVGTKSDTRQNDTIVEKLNKMKMRPILPQQGQELCRKYGMYCYVECSSKTQYGVDNVFQQAINASQAPPQKQKKKFCRFL